MEKTKPCVAACRITNELTYKHLLTQNRGINFPHFFPMVDVKPSTSSPTPQGNDTALVLALVDACNRLTIAVKGTQSPYNTH